MKDSICGIVVQIQEYREYDTLIRVLGNDNVWYTMHAKGTRKINSKNAFRCQEYMESVFYGKFQEHKTMHTVQHAEIRKSHRVLREDIDLQSVAALLCEMAMNCKEEQAHDLYSLLSQMLDALERKKNKYAITAFFTAKINQMLGIEPYVDGCVKCRTTKGICSVSLLDGGFLCKKCCRDTTMKKEQLLRFRLLCKASIEHFELIEQGNSWEYADFELMYRFFHEYSGIHLRSIRFFEYLNKN